MKFFRATGRLMITSSLVLSLSPFSIASQTYQLRSDSSRQVDNVRLEQKFDPAASQQSGSNPWIIDNRYEIDDPDDPGSSADEGGRHRHSRAVDIARQFRGMPYRWGLESPSRGFDCSGFVRYVYSRLGANLPRTAREQFHVGSHIRASDLRAGDILFFHTSRRGVSHVGIYIGGNQFIHAANPRKGVTISSLTGYYSRRLVGARRVPQS